MAGDRGESTCAHSRRKRSRPALTLGFSHASASSPRTSPHQHPENQLVLGSHVTPSRGITQAGSEWRNGRTSASQSLCGRQSRSWHRGTDPSVPRL